MTATELSDELEMVVTDFLAENSLPTSQVFTKADLDTLRRIVERIFLRAEAAITDMPTKGA